MFRRTNKAPLLGLDISSSSVKLLELSQTSNGYRIEAIAIEPLPERAIQDKEIIDPEAVAAAIRKAVKESSTRAKHACIAIPGSASISRVITLPADLSEAELAVQVRIEAEQYVPHAMDDVSLDYDILGPTAGNADNIDILIAASRTEKIEARHNAVDMGGLNVEIVDIEPFALENVFHQLFAPKLDKISADSGVALLDIGATTTAVNVFHQGSMIYTRDHPFGGRQHTDEIMRRYQLSYAEAGRAKRQGGLPESYEVEVLLPFIELVAQQISRFLQFFYAAHPSIPLTRILLGGGVAGLPDLSERIAMSTGVETQIANPFVGMTRSAQVSSGAGSRMLNEDATSMLIACGLALRSFD
ncbi:MAG: pilus assembly protein PilM [Halothiobacillaceae bacterium]